MVTLTDEESSVVKSVLEGYMKSPDGRCHAAYCSAGYELLQNVVKKISKDEE